MFFFVDQNLQSSPQSAEMINRAKLWVYLVELKRIDTFITLDLIKDKI